MAKKTKKTKQPEPTGRSHKEERLFQNLLKATQQFMQGKGFVSMTASDLIKRLGFPPQHTDLFHEVLNNLIKQDLVEVSRGHYIWKKTHINIVSGIIKVHARGFGFLQPDDPTEYPEDIFIPKHLTQNAVDGDSVEVEVNTSLVSEKGPEGRVVAILNRGRTHIAGIIRAIEKGGDILAYVPLLGSAQRVVVAPNAEHALQVGDRIVMEVVEWGSKESDTLCRVSHKIGHISDPSTDIPAAIEEYQLHSDFPHQAIEEAEEFGKTIPAKEIRAREDLRKLECFTIDPDTAKDYDDALSLSKSPEGHYRLGVHIADVSYYVSPGTALDDEAQLRCNSTYFPGYCLPMLPSALSENLCSIKANVNRLAATVFMDFAPDGSMVGYRVTRSVIKSAKRFTYSEAKEVLDGKRKSVHKATLMLMVELCHLLKRKRYERGSIEFALPELVVQVDEKGVPYGTKYVEYDVTHQLVEEFMLKANETVAWHLSEQGKGLTYRVHDEPAEEHMRDFSILAGAFGFRLSDKPTPAEIQKLFDEALNTPYGPYLATSYIRRMRLASYSPDNIGHYGLGLSHYCHFTSPIRRYVDLVVHRILFGESNERIDLEQIATRCSDQERISAKSENNVILLKKLRLLKANQHQEPHKQYEAIVTRVKNFGIFFEIIDIMLEGFLHVSELDGDFYVYDEKSMGLHGNRYGGSYCSGDRITVMLKGIDLIVLESEWTFVSASKDQRNSASKDQRKKTAKSNTRRDRSFKPRRRKRK